MNAISKSRLLLRGAAATVAVLLSGLSGPVVADDDATYVGEKACIRCHDTQNKHFGHTLHARIFRLNPKTEGERRVCEACHGPGSKHIANPTDKSVLIGFTRGWGTPIAQQNAKCLDCHAGGPRLHWPNSIHQINLLGCSDCHNPMARFSETGLLVTNSITETCYTCHQQQRAEFRRRSHMPVPEAKMSCVDCHNPHGTVTRPLLKTDTVNELCYQCHAEKRGPFIWEHAPVRASCLNCHHPHGSNHDMLLRFARPALCEQCHSPSVGHPGQFFRNDQTALSALKGGTPSQRVIGRACANCHTTVHGSNHPSGARFQR